MKALLSVCLTLFFLTFTFQQDLPCPKLDGYDLTNLTRPSYWKLDLPKDACIQDSTNPNSTCHFFFTFCHLLPPSNGSCVNSSVCQFNGDPNANILELGHYSENPFTIKEVNGFYAKFNGGPIKNKFTNNTCNVSVLFEFDCNKNQPWLSANDIGEAPIPTNFTGISSNSCEIYIKFDYAGACHRIDPPSTTSTTTALNPSPAKICIPPVGYNISILTQAPYWTFNIKSGCMIESNFTESCTLYMAFCKPIESLIDCEGSSACIRYPNLPGTSLIVGNYTVDPFTSYENDGFRTDYLPGVDIINRFTNKHCLVSISLKFDCDEDTEWEVPPENQPGIGPQPIDFQSISNTSCEIKMTVPYSGACKKDIKPGKKGLGAGSVLLIIFFVVLISYLLVGMLYNVFFKHETGYKIIPNYTFWTATLLYSLEGIIFTWRFVTCKQARVNKLKYESI